MTSQARQQTSRVFEVVRKAADSAKTKIADKALSLVGISDRLQAHDEEWAALGEYVTQHVACVLAMRPSTSLEGDILKEPWNQLQLSVQQIEEACSARLEHNTVHNAAFGDEDVQKIAVLRRLFDNAFGLFKLNLDLHNFTEAERFLSSLDMEQLTNSILTRVNADLVPQAIEALPYATGASWDPTKACLPGTRVEMIDKMWNFINVTDGATCAQIFWLVDVAGSGKTAIAHSVCKKASEAGLLVTSFFFDRMSAERNNPDKLITTMARDLATRDKRIASAMAAVLERDVGLRSASITRQFNDLIAQPAVKALAERQQPHVFVLDGMDEGMTPEEQLTGILAEGVRALPGNFRILVTSRPMAEIAYAFYKVDHIQKHTINLRSISNQGDIGTYMTHRLVEVASKRRRKLPWPEPSLALQLLKKSEGHFLWVSAVTEFLGRATNPDRQLDALLSLKGAPNTEAKMDQLYAAVLQTCPWGEDEDFVHGYEMYMGTVIAAKEPLTANVMQKLHGSTDHPRDMFEKIGSLITGFDIEDEVVRVLHLSLQEYVTLRAPSPYHLVQKEHSATLAVLCLRILNMELASDICALDTFSLDDPIQRTLPEITAGMISEPLHYASRFWPVHMADVVILSTDVKEGLHYLLSTHLIRWIKLCVCLGQYPSLRNMRDWLHTIAHDDDMLVGPVYAPQLAFNLTDIAWRLRDSGRREEAMSAAEDALVTVQHNLTQPSGMLQAGQDADAQIQDGSLRQLRVCLDQEHVTPSQACVLRPSGSSSFEQSSNQRARANSLRVFAACLSDMGHRQKGLDAIEEAVGLYRHLAKNHDMSVMPDLARSLNAWAILQGHMGRRKEALRAIEEAIQLQRVLMHKQGAAFTPELAGFLNNLSIFLRDLGRREAALNAIEEAIQLWRVLVREHQATFTLHLATALMTLSARLGDLGRREEALQPIEEAVQLQRALMQKQPATFTSILVDSLHNLSFCLKELGRREEALNAIEEAIQLQGVLVQEQRAAFTPGFVLNRSTYLDNMGRREEALQATEEAVQLQRVLVQENAVAFTPVLAGSLNNLSISLSKLGQHEKALNAIDEAVQLRPVLVLEHPTAFNSDLARSVQNLSSQLRILGRSQEALSTIKESVRLQRSLVQDHAEAFTPDLAQSLEGLADCQADMGRQDDALKAIEESVQLCRTLVRNQPTAFTRLLAHTLNTLSNRLGSMGLGQEGLEASAEAIPLYRLLVQEQAETFNPDLAISLYNQSHRWSETGRHDEAMTSAQEAHDLYRALAAERPAVFNREFKNSLERLSQVYAALGRGYESALAAREAEEVETTAR